MCMHVQLDRCSICSYHCWTGEVSVLISATTYFRLEGSLWIKSRAALPNTGYEPNAQLKGRLPCRGLERVRCQLVEVDLEVYGWIKKANQGMEVNELDMMAETFGMEIKELYQMAVMDELKVELYYEANMEGLYGKNWMWALTCWT